MKYQTFEQVQQRLMKNPKFKEEWYKPNMLGTQLQMLRIKKGLTQIQLAKMVGTKQSGISRAENSNEYLSLDLLHRITRILGYYVKIEFKEVLEKEE